jgi:hypothetical protein
MGFSRNVSPSSVYAVRRIGLDDQGMPQRPSRGRNTWKETRCCWSRGHGRREQGGCSVKARLKGLSSRLWKGLAHFSSAVSAALFVGPELAQGVIADRAAINGERQGER